jgi:hypothetical protein
MHWLWKLQKTDQFEEKEVAVPLDMFDVVLGFISLEGRLSMERMRDSGKK